jgi:hypothetical protein
MAPDLTGTWRSCVTVSGHDSLETFTFSGSSMSHGVGSYLGSDGSCTIDPTGTGVQATTFTLGGPITAPLGSASVTAFAFDYGGMYTIAYVDAVASPKRLYVGDLSADPLQDGTAAQKRPVVLADRPHLLQP